MREMNQGDEKLSAALRDLSASSNRSAPPELGLLLQDAFRQHHRRRKRAAAMRIAIACICVVTVVVGLLLLRKPSTQNANRTAVRTIPPQEVTYPTESSSLERIRPAIRKNSPHSNGSRPTDAFVALPSFDVVPAGDELRVVRVEMPGDDLRLVGASVPEAITGRRVTADFVVGHDGTPYAVRLVRTNFSFQGD